MYALSLCGARSAHTTPKKRDKYSSLQPSVCGCCCCILIAIVTSTYINSTFHLYLFLFLRAGSRVVHRFLALRIYCVRIPYRLLAVYCFCCNWMKWGINTSNRLLPLGLWMTVVSTRERKTAERRVSAVKRHIHTTHQLTMQLRWNCLHSLRVYHTMREKVKQEQPNRKMITRDIGRRAYETRNWRLEF